jgi:hypothetical protein
MKDKKIQWHPAFCSAIKLELRKNKKDLYYQNEYNLSQKPLQMDLLVIMKSKNAIIENEIGKIFLGHNIVEYKSPEDSMNSDTYFKTLAYAYLYKASESRVDEILLDDITISLIRDTKPVKLLRWFKENHYTVEEKYLGIYYIEKAGFFKTQVIVTSKLQKENHKWITALTKNLKTEQIQILLQNMEGLTEKDDLDFADAVLDVVAKIDLKKFKKIKKEANLMRNKALRELLQPEFEQAVKEEACERANKMANEMANEMANKMANERINQAVNEAVEQTEKSSEARSLLKNVNNVMESLNISLIEACNILKCTVDEYNNAKILLQK